MHADGPAPYTPTNTMGEQVLPSWLPLVGGDHTQLISPIETAITQEEDLLSLTDNKPWSNKTSGIVRFIPSVYYSVRCEAYLQEVVTTGSSRPTSRLPVDLVIAFRQAQRDVCGRRRVGSGCRLSLSSSSRRVPPPPRTLGGRCVGRTVNGKMVRPGHLRVRLVSKDFVADTERGEDAGLCKSRINFHGEDFEMKFNCRYKLGHVNEGTFGYVVVQHVSETGHVQKVLQFNLNNAADARSTLQRAEPTRASPPSPLGGHSAKRPIHDIAASLQITEDQRWRSLARHLGFSSKDLSHIGFTASPLTSLVSAYTSRGGTADEIIQAMYDIRCTFLATGEKRKRNSSPEVLNIIPEVLQTSPACSRCSPLTPPTMMRTSQMAFVLGDESDDDDNEAYTDFNRTLPYSHSPPTSPKSVFPLTSSPFTITPPTTPCKQDSSFESDCNSSRFQMPPSKRICRSLFSFHDTEDLSRRMCIEKPTDDVLWTISEHLSVQWRRVGNTLNMAQTELDNIACAHAHKCVRQCAYQMLLKWKESSPRKFSYGTLYSALCDNGLSKQAEQFCDL